jgi:hypothetical protein
MKWTVKVVSETESGHTAEQTLVAVERTDELRVEDLGLSLEEAKRLLATLQRSIVTEQIESMVLPTGVARTATKCSTRRGTTRRHSVQRSVACPFASDGWRPARAKEDRGRRSRVCPLTTEASWHPNGSSSRRSLQA